MLHFQPKQNEDALSQLGDRRSTSGNLHPDRPGLERPLAGTSLPSLCDTGHVLIVTAYYPPIPGGSSVIMRNLLSHFHPSSYSVVTVDSSNQQSIEMGHEAQVYKIMSSFQKLSYRLDSLWRDWQIPFAVSKLVGLIKQLKPKVIVGVYPSFHFLKITREAARITQVPWVAYLHDTLSEGLSDTRWAAKAAELEKQTFAEAASVLVMSRGMADLYQRKHGLSCQPLEHTYPEPIPEELPQTASQNQAFWGGDVYNINARAVGRVSKALQRVDWPFVLATKMTPEALNKMGIEGGHLKTTFYSKRAEYLAALRQQGILVLALDWPDESPKHEDELATIFPTKTPEYLATGQPILVHCPDHYFLAQFFKENRCGMVVTERSVEALIEAIRGIHEDSPAVHNMRQAALATARHFSAERIAARFQASVQAAL